jgi:hypothetical protein
MQLNILQNVTSQKGQNIPESKREIFHSSSYHLRIEGQSSVKSHQKCTSAYGNAVPTKLLLHCIAFPHDMQLNIYIYIHTHAHIRIRCYTSTPQKAPDQYGIGNWQIKRHDHHSSFRIIQFQQSIEALNHELD